MPYKNIELKKEWGRLHRPQRLARRQELPRIKAEQGEARPEVTRNEQSAAGFLVPLVAGGTLAACNPELGMAVGGLTLIIAAVGQKRLAMVDCEDGRVSTRSILAFQRRRRAAVGHHKLENSGRANRNDQR
jgi:hypothetical protein